jgi:hypothetical protein
MMRWFSCAFFLFDKLSGVNNYLFSHFVVGYWILHIDTKSSICGKGQGALEGTMMSEWEERSMIG